MKKRTITSIAAVVVALTTMIAYAASGIVMFGDNVSRTHVNGIADQYPWTTEATINSINIDGISLSGSQMYSSSTAMGAGNLMYFPIAAPIISINGSQEPDPTGQGYMTVWDMGNWSGGKPTALAATRVTGVSNSSPVVDSATGDAYLAAGTEFYRFHWDSATKTLQNTSVSIGGASNLNGGKGYSQTVSYPLFISASEINAPTDSIWISTQDGWIFAVDPSTMAIIYSHNFGVRFDASPSLAVATDGTPYIAVTGAYDANNDSFGGSSGTGMLFLINPKTGTSQYVANPYGPIPSTASPIATSAGHVMWNDTEGDVFLGSISPSGNVSITLQKQNIGNGQTSYLSESGYANGQYIVPFTDKGTYGYATVDPNVPTNQVERISISGSSGQLEPMGSPEISASGNMYLADQAGGIDRISPNPSNGNLYDGTQGGWLASFGASTGTPLSTPSELMLDTASGTEEPTLTLATNQGLELWDDVGANYTFGGDYTSTQPAQFTTPLALILGANDLPTGSGNSDQIAYSMSVNGGPFHYVTESPVYSGSTPQSQINLSTSLLNNTFAPWKQSGWKSSQTNSVVIRAYAPSSDQYGYTFNSADSGQDQAQADVTVTFPASGTTIQPQTPVYESDTEPFYVILRTIAPGSPDKEGAMAGYPPGKVPMNPVYQDTPIAESTDGSHSGVFSLGITDGYPSQLPITFKLKATMKTVIDQPYPYTYLSGYTRHHSCSGTPPNQSCDTWYTPNYKTITLYHNLPVSETAEQSFTMSNGESELWNSWNVTATIQGGSPSTMSLHGFAPFGAWVPPSDAYPSASNADYSQGGDLNGHIDDKGGSYPLNASPFESSTTNFAPYDAQHNDGVLVEPKSGAGIYPQIAGWNPQLLFSVVSGQQYFSHPGTEDFMQTWNFGIAGTNIGRADGTSTTYTWKWVPDGK